MNNKNELKELKIAKDAAWVAYDNAHDAANLNAFIVEATNTAYKNAGNAYRNAKKAYITACDDCDVTYDVLVAN